MKFIANKIHWIGILLLVGFGAAAAGLYFDVPTRAQKKPAAAASENYVCPMHPEVTGTKASDCSKCGMALKLASTITAADAHAGCGSAEGTAQHGCCSSKTQESQFVLPAGHPPVEGYTVQTDAHAGCNHGAHAHASGESK